ncbi:unnamed protein product [Dovyalis caffra]|uniref:Glycosyltransferase n=1 Tax=Dovyalis caffra TaxID=77055 RepID=A0AAV1SAZ5_9ROSI|nr:unnamed protein product [Dovyalis caffra]
MAVLRREKGQSLLGSRIGIAIFIGVLFGCVFAVFYPHGLFSSDLASRRHRIANSNLQTGSSSCELPERVKMLKADIVSISEKNAELKKQVRELNKKLQLAEQGQDHAQKQVLLLGKQQKAGPFGTVKGLRTNPTVVPDESVNPRLAKLLEEIADRKELIVALANSNVKTMLEVWFTNIKKAGIHNYLVVALDDHIVDFCKSNDVPVYKRNPDSGIDSVARTGGNHAVSGLKFRILREFLQLGYSVLLSDVDIIYLQNPFDHLHRDSDVESMSDGHNNMTAYGFNDVFDEPAMGWARYAHTMRIWVYNSGFFYIRPTLPSFELLDRVAGRLSREPNSWDQAVFNEELFFPSHPGYDGLHAAKRTMDMFLFMNSKVLFKTVRKDPALKMLKPVIVHVNYHPDKLRRMQAVVEFYVNGKQDALDPFPDGSDWSTRLPLNGNSDILLHPGGVGINNPGGRLGYDWTSKDHDPHTSWLESLLDPLNCPVFKGTLYLLLVEMERFSQRESVLLPVINHPSSSPKSQYGNSDVDFTDVFGGPPKRLSLQQVRYSFAETTDSFVSKNGDAEAKLSRNSLSGLREKPVFGDENVNRRRYPSNDFFDDIFKGNESLGPSPRKDDRDSFSSSPCSRVLSPAGQLPARADPWSPSLPAQFSLPAKLIKGKDLPTFISSARSHQKNKDGASNDVSNYTHSSLRRSASQTNQVRDQLTNDVSWQSDLSNELSHSSKESSNSTKPEETDKSRNLKMDSESSEVPTNGNQFHFSIYKWASKGMLFAMPFRGASKTRLDEQCKLQRCSSANGWIASEGIARELRSATSHDIDVPSFSSGMEVNKQDNHFIFDTSIQGEVEPRQIVEDTIFPISELDAPTTHQVIIEDGPGYSVLEPSIEIKHHSAPEMDLIEKTKEEISVVTHEGHNTKLKPLRSLLSENDDEQGTDEMRRKTEVNRTKKSSAVFDVRENVEDRGEKRATANSVEVDKANFQFSSTKSRDSLGNNRARGKVKEFVKIFNQEGSEKPNIDVNDSQHQGSRRTERGKFRTDNTMNVNNKNMPDVSILVDECFIQSEKQRAESKGNNLKSMSISSGCKDSSVSTAGILILILNQMTNAASIYLWEETRYNYEMHDAIGYFSCFMLTGRFWIPSTETNDFYALISMMKQHGMFHVHLNHDSYIPVMQFR